MLSLDLFCLSVSALAKYKHNEKLQEKKIKILCHQGKFEEAFDLAKNWKDLEPQVWGAEKWLKNVVTEGN